MKYKTLKLTKEELNLLSYLVAGEMSRCIIKLNENDATNDLENYGYLNRKRNICEKLLHIIQYLER